MANIDGDNSNNVLNGTSQSDTLNGRDGHDILRGGRGDDLLQGESGTDFLIGNQGSDTLYGGTDTDIIWGGNGNDIIDGGPGDDIIYGGAGWDRLTGGSGADTFVFDSRQKGPNVITDYNYAEGDRIDLRGLDGVNALSDVDIGHAGRESAAELDIADRSFVITEKGYESDDKDGTVSIWFDGQPLGDYEYTQITTGLLWDADTWYVEALI